jgi:hypothetical protein
MTDPRQVAWDAVDRVLKKGIAQGHASESWRSEPVTMHLSKGSRHGNTAMLLLDHPDFIKDKETAAEHTENMAVRAIMALTILLGAMES